MDVTAGTITTILLIFLFFSSEKIQVPKKINTAILSGFIVFVILTDKIALIEQKIGIIFVSWLLIFALNLKVKREPEDNSKSQVTHKTKDS